MPEPHDDKLDTWLSGPVQPLQPPPGTFERIRGRARRRKTRQVMITVAGLALAGVAVAVVPRVIIPRLSGPPLAISSSSHAQSPQPTAGPGSTGATRPSPTPLDTTPPVPPSFAVSSVTFVGTATGWVLGQAGVPGHCTGPSPYVCTSLARTDTAGASWYGVPAPVADRPSGPHGVSQIRFLNTADGWAFGPLLYATHDGGQHWTAIATHGLRVVALATVNGQAFAIWALCTGSGPAFAAHCTSFSLYSTTASSDRWAPVPGATSLTVPTAAPGPASPPVISAGLVLTGTTGYLLSPGGDLLRGPLQGGPWHPAATAGRPAPCAPGPAQADGQPSGALLASTGPDGLVLLCTGTAGGGTQPKTVYESTDGGRSWQLIGSAPAPGLATSLSGTPAGPLVLATTAGIEVSPNGTRWRQAQAATVPGGFTYVGMTTSQQGVAVPADTATHAVWLTFDGGHSWRESQVR